MVVSVLAYIDPLVMVFLCNYWSICLKYHYCDNFNFILLCCSLFDLHCIWSLLLLSLSMSLTLEATFSLNIVLLFKIHKISFSSLMVTLLKFDVWCVSFGRPIWYLLLILFNYFEWINAADSALESTDSDDEFQICEICNTEEVSFPLWYPVIELFWY